MLKRPKMIIFDFGGTLIWEGSFDGLKANKALQRYIAKNKSKATVEEIDAFSFTLWKQMQKAREIEMETHHYNMLKFQYEYLGIEFSIPIEEVEQIIDENAMESGPMPNIDTLISYLNDSGIRTGVISNIGRSGKSLERRINRHLPENKFEFIIASSEYVFRKPNPYIFELALRKADLQPDEVWYCGDSFKFDVVGSNAVGIFPVWYTNLCDEKEVEETSADFEFLKINDWQEMIDLLKV